MKAGVEAPQNAIGDKKLSIEKIQSEFVLTEVSR
jgi:hypothetical protein